MYKIRQIKYSTNTTSIQVYKIVNRKRVILRHIGTARSDQEKTDLLLLAKDYIEKISKQLCLFNDKTQKMLGIKGYYTNLEENIVNNNTIIERYHELYKIEHAFRITKSDLQTRPIFHFKEEPIKLHLLISFIALVISKHIELRTNLSIKKFIKECRKAKDARIINNVTGKEIKMRAKPSELIMELIYKLDLLT